METIAIFGQVEYAMTDAVNLTVGLRYTEDETDFEGCSQDQGDNSIAATWNAFFNGAGIPSNVAPGGCVTYLGDLQPSVLSGGAIPFPEQGVVKKSLKEDNVSGRIALDWQVSDQTLLYSSFSRGFKSGAFPNIDANVAVQYEPATQEEVKAYEVGVKSLFAEQVQVNASAYYYDYSDKQVYGGVADIIFNQLNRIVNVPESNIYGVEIDTTWQVNEAWTVFVSGSFMETEIEEYEGYNVFGVFQSFEGKEFSFSPEFQANAFVSYGFDIGESMTGRLTVDAKYSGEQQADLNGDSRFDIDAYTLWGAHLGLQSTDGHWEAELYARNLTDEYYWTSVQYITDTIVRFSGIPRTYGASLKYNF